jgi:hypothetical protein
MTRPLARYAYDLAWLAVLAPAYLILLGVLK